MNVRELMIGDLVQVNRDGLCLKNGTIVKVLGLDSECKLKNKGLIGVAGCLPLDKEQFSRGIWCEYLSPIPITPEILEKNFQEFLPGINLMYQLKGPYCATNEDGQWVFGLVKVAGENSARYPLVKISFVHQLQHALLLCGIEKEIVL